MRKEFFLRIEITKTGGEAAPFFSDSFGMI
jgi:hypothetical protein